MSANINNFDILREPVVTEKSYAGTGDANQYTFRIARDASKTQVKAAVEAIFEVEVDKVQVINMPSKPKRRGQHAGTRSGYRKAVVRLAEGHSLEIAEEV
ncbi:50S ribosomal protein L23 [Mariprofundus sp. EBB-1]|uniref:50S ribosomal protein L23 n=1 Tax=Mariprofundus sp. EBB-1 TaxID=2650971 RepID=UPI000EF26DC8|nr:50S ribosomal protein L23 [Mariprofundus sp. EBB-1]RLL53488.1 50S ribosomal protein L23 [Mariprofundus sp. EBB-1]